MSAATIDVDSLVAMRRRINHPTGRVRPPELDDPGQYTRLPAEPMGEPGAQFAPLPKVPLLDTCDVPGRLVANAQDLALIVANTNRRIARGEYPLLTIGHFREDAPETEQPPLVGFLRNFVVGTYLGEPCILADQFVAVQHYDEVMTYPRRSIEMWASGNDPASNYIDSVACLRRSPERDLGLITFAKSEGRDRLRVQMSKSRSLGFTAESIGKAIAEALRPLYNPSPPTAAERAAVVAFASRNGITDLAEARRRYRETYGGADRLSVQFAKGGPTDAKTRAAVVAHALQHQIVDLTLARESYLRHCRATGK